MTKEQELKAIWDAVVKTAKAQEWRKENEMMEVVLALLPGETPVSISGDFDFRHADIDGVTIFSEKLHEGHFDGNDGFLSIQTLVDLRIFLGE